MSSETKVIRAQPGKQEMFLRHSADICIYGGAAGGGKTYALLLEPCYHLDNPHFEALILRQQNTQIVNTGGLWDVSHQIYPLLGGRSVQAPKLHWRFPSGARVSFGHIARDSEVYAFQGSQIPLLCCEETTPVLMADGSYRPIRDIRTGDMVQTLQGPRMITATGDRELRECVRAELPDGSCQIQSVDHKVLTGSGWLSYQDLPHYQSGADDGIRWLDNASLYDDDRFCHTRYVHPYTGKYRASMNGGVKHCPVRLTPVGKRWTVNITVEGENHYITESRLINRNCFDELTHFSKHIFFYMLSRNRSSCGIKPYVRATCNPDAESWVADFISWWIDQETGYPIAERCGKIRWFIQVDEALYWADTREELWEQFNLKTPDERSKLKSVSFVSSTLQDNKILMETDPSYLANLEALPLIERERLLNGNWKIRAANGLFFKRVQLGSYLTVIPKDVTMWVRCWDLAASEKTANDDPAYTAGVLMGKRKDGRYIVADVINRQMSAADVRKTIKLTAQQDKAKYGRVRIRIPQDPGQAGKEQAASYIKFLSGYDITAVPETGSKESRASPMAAQWQAGNFDIVSAPWNEQYLLQLENFPGGKFKDMVDASANAFAELELRAQFNLSSLL